MNIIYEKEQYANPVVIALGFFDCVHIGHLSLVNETKKMASILGCESAIYTFLNDPNVLLGKKEQIYTFEDRKIIFDNLEIDNVVCSEFTQEFASLSPKDFLDSLFKRLNIVGVVAGKDFTFGKNAEGNSAFLKKYLAEKAIDVKIMPFEKVNSQKIATSQIKKMIAGGDVDLANQMLTQPYCISGEVVHARHRGTIIGFPTANIQEAENKIKLSSGIYITKVHVDNKIYVGVTNVGAKPTFEEPGRSIETYILNFNQDIYGKTIQVDFYKKIRDVIKFSSVPSLCNQMKQDEIQAREYFSI